MSLKTACTFKSTFMKFFFVNNKLIMAFLEPKLSEILFFVSFVNKTGVRDSDTYISY